VQKVSNSQHTGVWENLLGNYCYLSTLLFHKYPLQEDRKPVAEHTAARLEL